MRDTRIPIRYAKDGSIPVSLLEALTRRCAKHTTRAGKVVLVTDGDRLLVAAFKSLGWDDPHVDADTPAVEAATVQDVERAVLPRPKGAIPPLSEPAKKGGRA